MARNVVEVLITGRNELTARMNKAAQAVQKFRSAALGMSIAVAPMVAAMTDAVRVGTQFEQTMRNVQSVSGATGAEFEKLTVFAKTMGETTVFTAREAGDALYYLASAGYDVGQQMGALPGILDFAAATQSDLASSTELVVSTLNAFSMQAEEAGRVSNVFAAGISATQLTMERLRVSMPYVSSVAASLNIQFEEAVATIGLLTSSGIRAQSAGRLLASSLLALMDPSKEATDALKQYGIHLHQVNPSMRTLAEMVNVMAAAHVDATAITRIFGKEGARVWLSLIPQGGQRIRQLQKDITGTNKANEMAAIQLNSVAGQWKILNSMIEGIKIEIFDRLKVALRDVIARLQAMLPEIKKVAVAMAEGFAEGIGTVIDYLLDAVRWFNSLDEATRKTIAQFAGLTAAVFALIGPIALIASFILPSLLNPIGLVAIAIMALTVVVFKFRYDVGMAFATVAEAVLHFVQIVFEAMSWLAGLIGQDPVWIQNVIDAMQRAREAVNEWGADIEKSKAAAAAARREFEAMGKALTDVADAAGGGGVFGMETEKPPGVPTGPAGFIPEPPIPADELMEHAALMREIGATYDNVQAAGTSLLEGIGTAVGTSFGQMLMHQQKFSEIFKNVFKMLIGQIVGMIVALIAKLLIAVALMSALGLTSVRAFNLVGLGDTFGKVAGIGKQTGGVIFGGGGKDNIVTRLSAGELVIPERLTTFFKSAFGRTAEPAYAGAGALRSENHYHFHGVLDSQTFQDALDHGELGEKIREAVLED